MKTPKCNQCDSMTINGVYCHETGCPNSKKKFVDGEWVTMLTCDVCGYDFQEGLECCVLEETN